MAAGLWVAPLDPATGDTGPSGLATLMDRVGAELVLADRAAPAGVGCRWLEVTSPAHLRSTSVDPSRAEPAPPAATGGVVLSSSGTTGPPKVVRLHQDKLVHTARCVAAHHRLSVEDRGFNPLPLFHINAEVVGLLATLVAGSCLVLDDRFHRTGFWEVMERCRVTWINAVPAIILRLTDLRRDEVVPAGIRFIRSASAPLPVATAERFEAQTGIPLVETYGMTEAASQITAHPVTVPRRAGSVGVPVGLELRVVRQDTSADGAVLECPPGEVGQVEIHGASVIERYEGGDHADRFRPGGWLRTGDLGYRDGDGFLYLVARTDDVINRGGEKVYPREIEEVVSADPDVVGVAVVGQDDHELGQVPVAFVVLRDVGGPEGAARAGETAARVNEALERSLVRAKRPVTLQVVQSLPAGATGKVRRRALLEPGLSVLHTFACP